MSSTAGATKLVIGASGFLGSHVTRQLVDRGDEVRVLLRHTSSTKAIDDLEVQRHYGDVFDEKALREAMSGVDDVFYCVVDARAWLRDPAPLFRTNVEGLQHVLNIAVDADLRRFVFTSSIATIGIPQGGRPANEDDAFNWADRSGSYIQSRVQAEDLVMKYAHERGLPAVAMCVSNTYGPGDWQPTPHGRQISLAAMGKMPFYIAGWDGEVVGIEDAAAAMLLAADRGRNGERYIVSERMMSAHAMYEVAAKVGGVAPPRFGVPIWLMYLAGCASDAVTRVLRRDSLLSRTSVRLMHIMPPLDHGKAERELGWRPAPIHESIDMAARWFRDNRKRLRSE
ncbi:NAD-dependent epimerase/dehydratase family protein [Mycolicibacterium hodleri]|uniref:NAD-dependent epimerase/dehydratase family protein n=1 Tax=Mycolicibacterium hodleri TaxID=49897 RepID=A0A502E9C8_9MYCO|nr:NAD-dependent epimerase/dehydratase family protein [Mycolicibacterium hodleri]TPG33070.1 NAD-dependent epimerase/dehydratase family protein [Mycolicibacterium hodleri]